MKQNVKKCHNLRYDKKNDEYYCGTTHVCYKECCFRDIFEEIKSLKGHIIHTLL